MGAMTTSTIGHMKAGIELTGEQEVRGGKPGTALTQAIMDATRALLAGGGVGTVERSCDRDVKRYEFDGPVELVRPVIEAFMAFIGETQ